MPIDRRRVLVQAAALGGAAALAGCARGTSAHPLHWHMVTAWPGASPGFGTGARRLAQWIETASNGRLRVTVHGGFERVAPFGVFDAVASGEAQMGHSAAHYWQARAPAAVFFATVPFGLTAQEMSGWLYQGGGLALWRELYAGFGLVPFPAGNTGMQTAGWYNREITSTSDLVGLKIRMPGLGGEVMRSLGAVPVHVDGSQIYTALKSGALDAAEWVAPFHDAALGLHRVAKYCYYPGWHEPGTSLECIVNKTAYEALPEDLQTIVSLACRASNEDVLADFSSRNATAAVALRRDHGALFRLFPGTVLDALRSASETVVANLAAADPFAARVHDSYRAWRKGARAWQGLSDVTYLQAGS